MKKILIVSTVSRQFYLFEQGNIEVLNSLGYEVHTAANFSDANERLDTLNIIRHHFDIERSPFSLKNIKAYKQLKKIMKSEKFDIVHCHSPMGGVLARLAAKSVEISPVMYTAHGFHFFKGAPLINWILYYPIEKWLSKYTDILITINMEDFERAKKFKPHDVMYVPGIGVDTNKFSANNFDRVTKRKEIGVSESSFLILSIGELNKNKNHETIIRSLAEVKNKDITYVICGQGKLESYLKELAEELGLSDKVKLLGFRNDVNEICLASDLFAFPSYREGLSVSLMEAMSAGLPIVTSEIRGNIDLVNDGYGGFLHDAKDYFSIAKSIDKLVDDVNLRLKMGRRNIEKVKKYEKQIVIDKMEKIYNSL